MPIRRPSVIPGFGLTLGLTVVYLSVIVLIPLAALMTKSASTAPSTFWSTITEPRLLRALQLSVGASAVAAIVNAVFGLVIAWTLVRYSFPGKRLIDALVDLPFALPTAVSGLALTAIYAPTGWLGQYLAMIGVKSAYSPLGVTIALTFVGLPFVVRTVQPAIQELDAEIEDAASVLGADRWQTFRRVLLPAILPSLLTGVALSFARALGEYGSVVFIGANLPMRTEIVPHLIISKLEQFNYAAAAAIGTVMLGLSFAMLLVINLIQWRLSRHQRKAG
jgi:sulfate/thiosulfate transport system permease protein